MRVGVLGTGIVGPTLGSKLTELGHHVKMGSRSSGGEKASAWAASAGARASEGSFADAAAYGDLVINATAGAHVLDVLRACGSANLAGKVLVDVSNPLDFSAGFPPTLSVSNTNSVAEQIQREFPEARVVKTLNSVSAAVMVNPGMIPGGSNIFVSGNDVTAKREVRSLLGQFGWSDKDIVDLGDITTARGPEMYLALWVRLMGPMGTGHFNIRLVREA
jgi:predicted dinucleotide-binding enzyme